MAKRSRRITRAVWETKKVRVGWKLECLGCGEDFISKRKDPKACSARCRKRLFDRRKRAKRRKYLAESNIWIPPGAMPKEPEEPQ